MDYVRSENPVDRCIHQDTQVNWCEQNRERQPNYDIENSHRKTTIHRRKEFIFLLKSIVKAAVVKRDEISVVVVKPSKEKIV